MLLKVLGAITKRAQNDVKYVYISMTEKRFNELYLDSAFNNYARGILRKMYSHYKDVFQNNALDIEDLEQECWASLYERVGDDKDRDYCYVAMKNAAIDLIRSMNHDMKINSLEEAGIQ